MVTQSRKTILKNPLDEISSRVKSAATAKKPSKAPSPAKATKVVKTAKAEKGSKAAKTLTAQKAEKTARPRKQNVVPPTDVRATEENQATSVAKQTVAASESVQKAQPQPSPTQTTPAEPAVMKASATTQPLPEVKDAKAASTQTAEQLMAAEIARSAVPTSNRIEEIVSDPCTPVKVLEQPGALNSPTVGVALPGSYLTAEDIFQNELSRARVSLKAEATQTKLAAQKIVTRWSRWSVAVSFIPAPFVDMAAISGVQVKMIYDLCKLYKVDFEHKAALAIASGVAGGAATQTLAGVVAKQMVRFAPGIGPVFMFAIEPSISYVTSQAIGMAFISHFEADGRMHDFQPEKIRQYIAAQIEKRRSRSKDKTEQAQA
jgi:uncharacterized protein (DUF697 family)